MATDGVHRASVTDVADPLQSGRVRVTAGRGGARAAGVWAPVLTPAAPAAGDVVYVAYEDGDRDRPVVVGALGRDALRLHFGGSSVELAADGSVRIDDAGGNAVTLAAAGITITATASVSVQAAQVQVSAGTVTVDAGMSRFAGVVQCDTLVANAVVAQSYTPGAGNIS